MKRDLIWGLKEWGRELNNHSKYIEWKAVTLFLATSSKKVGHEGF